MRCSPGANYRHRCGRECARAGDNHRRRKRLFVASGLAFSLAISACASKPFESPSIGTATFVERSLSQTQDIVTVTAAVPGAEETEALLGLDLYAQGIQPVWLKVENRGENRVRVALLSVDREYFSPQEVAYTNRKPYSKEGLANMQRWFYENQMPRWVLPGEAATGFIFTHLTRGTKGFNVDVYQTHRSFNFTFFIPLPGFRPDFMDVNFDSLYSEQEIQAFDAEGLRAALVNHPCCSTDASGSGAGDPFNVVMVGSGLAIRRALLRGGWEETAANSRETVLARSHRYRGRQPDGTFHKLRPDGTERKELRLWLAPMRVGDEPVWIGQVSYDMRGATGARAYEEYQIDPDIDDARMFIMQNFWYGESLARLGFVGGVPRTTLDAPARDFSGSEFFTDGLRVVLFVSEVPVAMDETIMLSWQTLAE